MIAGMLGIRAGRPQCRRHVLRAGGLLAGAGLSPMLPRSARALSPMPQDWLYGARHISVVASVQIQEQGDPSDRWRILRRRVYGGDPPQASPNGLIRNDLEGDGERPAVIAARARGAAQRLLAGPPSTWRNQSTPPPALVVPGRPPSPEFRDAQVYVAVLLYVRDISQDLVFPPPTRVASVMLIEMIEWSRTGRDPQSLRSGPSASVETVVRSGATDWMLDRLDAAVGRALQPWIISR